MKKINYQLIASDFDGTLLTSDQKIPQNVVDAISQYVNDGGIFAVCTGRMLSSILPRVRSLNLKGLVVAYQGTVIADIETGKILKKGGMSNDDAVKACEYLEKVGATASVYADEVMYTNLSKDDELLKIYERITGVNAVCIKDMPLSQFTKQKGFICQKVSSLVLPEKRDELYADLKQNLQGNYDITCSAVILVEISPSTDTKGEAVKFLCDYYGVPIEKSIAVGDNLNDKSMIVTAGLGIAVGNASNELKTFADHVADTNDNGAIAQIIKQFGYEND